MTALYRQISDQLRRQIASGALADKLPTEPELKAEWDASIGTVRNALKLLEAEGVVQSKPPKGWYVRRHEHLIYRPQTEGRTLKDLSDREPWIRQILDEGRVPAQTIDVAIEAPPSGVAERLELDKNEYTAVRKRVRYVNDAPVNLNDSYYPLKIVEGSEVISPSDIPEGVSKVLSNLGYVQCRAIDEIDVRMPTPSEQERLQLGKGIPVAIHQVTTFTAAGAPVRCTINVLPGDRHRIVFERQWDAEG